MTSVQSSDAPMRRRVLVVQPWLQPPGGGPSVAVWALEALKADHDLHVLTWVPVDIDAINRFYGTSLHEHDLKATCLAAPVLRHLIDAMPGRLALLKRAFLLRAAKKSAPDFDVVFTAADEADFGVPGIQYVHFPVLTRPRPRDDVRWYHGPPIVLDAYFGFCDWLAGLALERMKTNVTLVNSRWTGQQVREKHRIDSVVVHPPVCQGFAPVAWHDRQESFLCIGRFAPEKQLHRVIDILSAVRRRRPDISLRMVGTVDGGRYSREILRRAHAESAWITVSLDLPRQELLALMPNYRYGLHGMPDEHFGMACAELVSAGCIVFVPRGGGQVEIVGDMARLTYGSIEEAADNILHVLEHPDEQARIRQHLSARTALFSTERFMRQIRDVVSAFPSAPQAGSGGAAGAPTEEALAGPRHPPA